MRINGINSNTFKGLWGAKIGISGHIPVEVRKIDKYYPFSDDTKMTIKDEIKEGKENGVYNQNGELFPEVKEITIMEELPFSRLDYYIYKSKNSLPMKKTLLTKKDKLIENFLDVRSSHGLAMYKNNYIGKPKKHYK